MINKTIVLGLTGGIGTGKSTVSKIFNEKGIKIINLDEISHDIIDRKNIVDKLIDNFGNSIFDKNTNQISRKELGKIVFKDKEKLKKLNSIMHPEILKIMREKIKFYKEVEKEKIIIVEVPLLFEINLEKEFDKVILVYSNRETQVKRIIERDNRTEEEALNIINSQMDLEEKKKKSDYILENNSNIDNLLTEIEKLIKILEN